MPDAVSAANLAQAFFAFAAADPGRIFYVQPLIEAGAPPEAPRRQLRRSAGEAAARVRQIAHYLRAIGVERGARVAIVSATRPEWVEADLAVLSLGAVVVCVYPNLPPESVGYILYDSGSDVVFAENREQVDKILELVSGTCSIPATEEREAAVVRLGMRKIISFEPPAPHPLVVGLPEILCGGRSAPVPGVEAVGSLPGRRASFYMTKRPGVTSKKAVAGGRPAVSRRPASGRP